MIIIINNKNLHLSFLGSTMNSKVRVDSCCGGDIFCIRFHNSTVNVSIDDLLHIMIDLVQSNPSLFEVSLQRSLQPHRINSFDTTPAYRLIFDRTILLFSEKEVVEFLSQMWIKNPMLMHWTVSHKQACS